MRSFNIKIVLVIAVLITSFALSVNAQIYSTSAGGPWDSTWTWVGNLVPTAAYDVVISGAVYTSNNACHNLTISSTGSLYNSTYDYTLAVSGELTNNGLIQSQSSNYSLTLNVNGNVYNNATILNRINLNISGQIINDGIWDNYNTALTGSANQHFSCINGNSFSSVNFYNNKTGGDIYIDTFVYFDGVQINFNNHDFQLSANTTLKIHNGRLLNCNLIGEGELSVVLGEGTYNVDAPEYENVSFTDLALHGENNIVNSNCSTHGTLVNNGSLQNYTYAGTLNTYDDFINNGVIKDISNNYPFTIRLYGDFYNNGSITNEYFYPYSSSDQSISGLNGNPYSPVNFKSYKPSGKMIMATDIEFQNCIIDMQGDTLYVQNDILTQINGGRMQNTPLMANGAKSSHIKLFMENNAYLDNCHIYSPEILGRVLVGNNNFYGDVLITDTLQNNTYSYTTAVSGDLTNNGLIQSQSSSYYLTINVSGDVYNNATILNRVNLNISGQIINDGIWDNYNTALTGAANQQFSCINGHSFSSINFYNNKTGGDIYIDELVYFDDVQINFNDHDFQVSENTTLKILNGKLLNCNLIGEGELSIILGDGTYNVDAPEYDNVSFTDIAIHGENNIAGINCSTHGTVVNNGSLQAYNYGGTLSIYDNFRNNGIIKDYSNSYPFTIRLYGDFINNGSLTNKYFYPYSDSDQSISGLNGNPYSPVNFKSYKPSGKMIMATDIEFQNCIIDMQGDTLYVQDDILTHINGGRMQNTPLKANGAKSSHIKLFMENNAYLDNCHIYSPEILGEVLVRNNNFYGDILVTDTLQNNTYTFTTTVSGDVTNNGLIKSRDSNYSLTLNVDGNVYNNATILNRVNLNISGQIINDGIWDNHNTAITGSANQHFSCINGHSFSSYYFYNNKTGGDIYIDTLVYFDGVQINFNDHDFPISANTTLKIHDGWLSNCNLIGDGELSVVLGEGTYNVDAPEYDNVSFTDLALHGENNIANSNCSTHGTVVNNGSLQSYTYGGTLYTYDDFINNGVIKDISNNYHFTIRLYGDFYNNGSITNEYFYPYSNSDQSISGLNGNPYSPVNFKSYKPSGKMIMATDIEFQNCVIDMQGDTLYVQDDILTQINGGRMQNTPLKANGAKSSHIKLFMENNAYLDNCHIYSPEILGEVLVRNNNFYGDVLVTDTMRNNTYGYTLTVSGDLTNNGLIQSQGSFSYSIITLNVDGNVYNNATILNRVNLNIYDDLTNNGIMDNYQTQMIGASEQYVHLQNGNYITGQMRFVSDINTSPYQWYWNTWAIQNPPYPDPAIFSGETSNTLVFLNDVDSDRLGTYYCNTGGGNSRSIVVDEITVHTSLELTAIIEGPFNGSNMNTTLNSLTLLPLDQPYSIAPWNYGGVESVTSIPNVNVVDWILVQMYDAPSAALISAGNMIFESVAFLLDDGSVVDLDGSSDLSFELSIVNSLFVKLYHRNHIPIISATGLTKIGNTYSFDFTTSISKAYQSNQKNIAGKAVMIGGDANADAAVDLSDISIWTGQAGINGYEAGDINMDGEVNNPDKNDIILENLEIESPASYNILRGGPAGTNPEAIPVQISGVDGANPYLNDLNQWTGNWQAPQAIYDQGTYVNDHDNWSNLGSNYGSTWINGAPGTAYGILVVDLQQLRSIYNISVFQMFSDGKTTHIAFAGHAETGSTAPDALDTGWVEFLSKSSVGAGVNGDPITAPTKFPISTSTRFVKIMVWNDGSLGSSGYIELKGVKMY